MQEPCLFAHQTHVRHQYVISHRKKASVCVLWIVRLHFALHTELPCKLLTLFRPFFSSQGVVTPISTVLRAATGNCDPVYGGCRCGLPYYSIYYQKVTQSRWIFATVTGHRQFSSAVTRSQAVFGRSQIVTPVAALSTAHIGVTTPCFMKVFLRQAGLGREQTNGSMEGVLTRKPGGIP